MHTQSKGLLQHMPRTPSDVEQLNSALREGELYAIVKEPARAAQVHLVAGGGESF